MELVFHDSNQVCHWPGLAASKEGKKGRGFGFGYWRDCSIKVADQLSGYCTADLHLRLCLFIEKIYFMTRLE